MEIRIEKYKVYVVCRGTETLDYDIDFPSLDCARKYIEYLPADCIWRAEKWEFDGEEWFSSPCRLKKIKKS